MKLKKGEIPPKNKHKNTWGNRWKRLYHRITNRHLRYWYFHPKWMAIKGNPDRNRIFRNRGSYKKDKEITEAMALITAMKKKSINPDYILDIGSGVGFLSQLASIEYPNAMIIAVDNNSKMRTDQFDAIPNGRFWLYNINWMDFDWWLSEIKGTIVVAGVHLCFNLSPRLVEIFNTHDNVDMMVLSPCCHRGGENYELWMAKNFDLIESLNKEQYRDGNILSVRDGVIIAERGN